MMYMQLYLNVFLIQNLNSGRHMTATYFYGQNLSAFECAIISKQTHKAFILYSSKKRCITFCRRDFSWENVLSVLEKSIRERKGL